MLELQFIGNLGRDAEIKNVNGRTFVAFNVGVTERRGDQSRTTWISCTLNGDGGGLTQYLRKGVSVFVRGNMAVNTYQANGQTGIDVKCFVDRIQLCGTKNDNSNDPF